MERLYGEWMKLSDVNKPKVKICKSEVVKKKIVEVSFFSEALGRVQKFKSK